MLLKMLIVDEGFGTQDREGCDRLLAAIEAIAPDFACILTITHMPTSAKPSKPVLMSIKTKMAHISLFLANRVHVLALSDLI